MKKILLSALILAGMSVHAQFWTPKATGFATASRGIDDISIVDDNVIWVKAYDGSGLANQAVKDYARSTDGGNTWIPGTFSGIGINSNLGISSLHAISATTAWMAGHPIGSTFGGIWKTTNSGTTWTKQSTALFNTGTDSFTNLVYFWDANNGVCQGDPASGYFEIYTTSNGGTTWTRVPSANIPAPLADEYGYVHNYDVVGDIIWFGTSKGRLYKSVDKGLNWTVSQTPVSDFAGATESGNYSFSTATKGILNTSNFELYSTIDGGATWLPVVSPTFFGDNDIEYVPGTSMIVATSTAAVGSATLYSLDDGLTWDFSDDGIQVTELKFLNATTGFGGGFNTSATAGGIFKYTGNFLRNAAFQAQKLTASPNPTSGTMQLTGAPLNQVTVYDLLGKQVYQSNFAALSTVNVDLSALQSGAYFLKATSDTGAIQTIKILKN